MESVACSVFISYAHKDNESPEPGKRWLDRLMEQLEPLIQQNQVKAWSDRDIEAGEDWHKEVQDALQNVKAAVLLISPSFLASKYIRNSELPVLLKQVKDNGVIIIPLILRPSLFCETKFKYPDPAHGPEEFSLASLQAANSPQQPLNNMTEYEQDQVLVAVAQRLLRIVGLAEDPRTDPTPAPGTDYSRLGRQQSRSVSAALRTLSELMSEPEVHDAVIAFRTDFKAASWQIEVLKGYKDLHDRLHVLQFQCYEGILAESSRFPGDEVTRDNLADHEQTLVSTLVQIRRGTGSTGQFDTSWMVRDLDLAWKEMHAALEDSDSKRLSRAASLLGRVLNVYPAQINSRLNETAKTLRLPSLVRAMMVIHDNLMNLNLDPDKVAQFADGVGALNSLNGDLSSLLQEHDKWQVADAELRLIHTNLGSFMEDLAAAWPRLKEITGPLYDPSTEEWAVNFKTTSENLGSALDLQNLMRVRDCFRRYRRWAGLRFFEVDVRLKILCSNLLTVGEPLVSVLRMLE